MNTIGTLLVTICVCTYKRPIMLATCLQSLSRQIIPDGITAEIVVVDNDEAGSARSTVNAALAGCKLPIRYTMQRKRGIAAARNEALSMAMRIGADQIAFIDDDEVAEPNWLSNLMAPEYLHVPILQGSCINVYPESLPFWAVPRCHLPASEDEGAALLCALTGNVRFSAKVAHAGLRFDESIGLGGGEDIDFFRRANDAGFAIRKTNRAVTYETVHPERMTYRAQIYTAYWSTASTIRMCMLAHGLAWAWRHEAPRILRNAISGALVVLSSPLYLLAGVDAFKRQAVNGGRCMGKAAGRVAGLLGIAPQVYRNVAGG